MCVGLNNWEWRAFFFLYCYNTYCFDHLDLKPHINGGRESKKKKSVKSKDVCLFFCNFHLLIGQYFLKFFWIFWWRFQFWPNPTLQFSGWRSCALRKDGLESVVCYSYLISSQGLRNLAAWIGPLPIYGPVAYDISNLSCRKTLARSKLCRLGFKSCLLCHGKGEVERLVEPLLHNHAVDKYASGTYYILRKHWALGFSILKIKNVETLEQSLYCKMMNNYLSATGGMCSEDCDVPS